MSNTHYTKALWSAIGMAVVAAFLAMLVAAPGRPARADLAVVPTDTPRPPSPTDTPPPPPTNTPAPAPEPTNTPAPT